MEEAVTSMENKPSFIRDQIISISDIQRNWRKMVEPKLEEYPFIMMFSGSDPKAAFLNYEKFEELWSRAEEASELKLRLELLSRVLSQKLEGKQAVALKDVISKAGITEADIEEASDVELE